MKKTFKDNSSIEIKKQDDNVVVIIRAKDSSNPNKLIVNAVEISLEEFKSLISEI